MINASKFFWWLLQIDVSFLLEESIVWKLESLGINSFAIEFSPDHPDQQKLTIWLPSNEWSEKERHQLFLCLGSLSNTFGITLESPCWEKIDQEDWSLTWKKSWKPDPVGDSLLILPAWLELPQDYLDRTIVRIDPGSAFGSGSHPTTRLCLEALERTPPRNLTITDLGCGSGILGITALCLGAQKVLAIDTDSLAINSTTNNFLLNDLPKDSLFLFHGSIRTLLCEGNSEKADLLLCNILLPVIKLLAKEFDQILKVNGKALLSGILVEQIPELSNFLKPMGWVASNSWEKSNWGLLEVSRA